MNIPIWSRDDLPKLLAQHLERGGVDHDARRRWTPQLCYGRHEGPAAHDARAAAVAVLLCREQGTWQVPLTVRAASLSSHASQVSFPGGLIDPRETSEQAAQRELAEELGVSPPIEWIGQLEPLYVFVSNRALAAWIGVVDGHAPWRPNPAEVESVLTLPLRTLLAADSLETLVVRRGNFEFTAPTLKLGGFDVWGSTGVLLGELRGRLLQLCS